MINIEKNKAEKIPGILLAGWAAFLLGSIFLTPPAILLKGTVILSIVTRLAILFSLWIVFQFFYGHRKLNQKTYEALLMYIGYALVFTYVFSMLPQVVSDYHQLGLWGGTPFYVIWIILTSLWPGALWLWINLDKTRVAMGAYDSKQVKLRRERLKDRSKKKAYQKKLRKERNRWQNIWSDWIEPFFGAVIWVLIINHFVLELYQIPSESMVPTFLVKDKVLVGKSFYAPNIPMTQYKLPRISRPQTGEIIIFTNPKMEDPESDLYHRSVFSRVFYTFVYKITFTAVDMDRKPNGEPKERMLVKRNIAGPGEKLCILNDQVYKRVDGGEWTLMSEIEGEREYGWTNLYFQNVPQLRNQAEIPETRMIIDEAIELVESWDPQELEAQLEIEKRNFIGAVSRLSDREVMDFSTAIHEKTFGYEDYVPAINYLSGKLISFNNPRYREFITESYNDLMSQYYQMIEMYPEYILTLEARNLEAGISKEWRNPGHFQEEIQIELMLQDGDSPYQDFMARLNGIYKLEKMKFYTSLIQNGFQWDESILEEADDLYKVLFYTRGFGNISTFGFANLPEFPAGSGNFIAEDEFFLMGDNRYNSLDSRMGDTDRWVAVDPRDDSAFALYAFVRWDPHTIPLRLIHGKFRLKLPPIAR